MTSHIRSINLRFGAGNMVDMVACVEKAELEGGLGDSAAELVVRPTGLLPNCTWPVTGCIDSYT